MEFEATRATQRDREERGMEREERKNGGGLSLKEQQ